MAEDRVPLQQTTSEPLIEAQPTGKFEGSLGFMDNIEYHRMSDLLGISYTDRNDVHLAEKISLLVDWAREQAKSDDRLEQHLAIKRLTRGLGYVEVGKTLVEKLHRWVRLDLDRQRIEKQQELLK